MSGMRPLQAVLVLVPLLVAGVACSGSDDVVVSSGPGPYQLTFSLNASFQGPHGGDPIQIAVVRRGAVVAQAGGTVSATQNPPVSE